MTLAAFRLECGHLPLELCHALLEELRPARGRGDEGAEAVAEQVRGPPDILVKEVVPG
eukprot:CAMPEP_0185167896 /NCGR_PEP_ID=MMETSP1139-20130426/15049_1 /TAXON_ID=298111 /ORGANISM="Pavlova sp., Strain CCMP459" /LENGTH=57 /DNA_ID=CAMNT_0027733393 /DNA_START=610 /DNA_END=780 /DNA_ORIENTATION=+